ncbi:DUF4172 domain-containing protein [Ectopseudomonas hydrolytica]|uniref:DUF4172 domain-containing protein n=1 Tax=Ectopseudomonas hydrolytica TaxID=2493633 RepID=A0ABY5A7N7_9GAMM|nr:DUF4172 domain-containing protein [Pseudomonas hydrolytica]USR39291.1 DUF4172 domain-containing protein [Pseudomonas hydrolytica]
MNDPLWIWQQSDWPHFSWQAKNACTAAARLRSGSRTFVSNAQRCGE